ncbi:MAG: hypothetical protein RIF39_07540, partial [Cyclobacteriaceae bacterium]
MRFLLAFCLFIPTVVLYSQQMENPIPARLAITDRVPEDLLAKRSCVFYSSNFSDEELETIQSSFQQSGVDAVAYLKSALVFAGADVTQKIADFLIKREIEFIVLISKKGNNYSFLFTSFNANKEFVNNGQPG